MRSEVMPFFYFGVGASPPSTFAFCIFVCRCSCSYTAGFAHSERILPVVCFATRRTFMQNQHFYSSRRVPRYFFDSCGGSETAGTNQSKRPAVPLPCKRNARTLTFRQHVCSSKRSARAPRVPRIPPTRAHATSTQINPGIRFVIPTTPDLN